MDRIVLDRSDSYSVFCFLSFWHSLLPSVSLSLSPLGYYFPSYKDILRLYLRKIEWLVGIAPMFEHQNDNFWNITRLKKWSSVHLIPCLWTQYQVLIGLEKRGSFCFYSSMSFCPSASFTSFCITWKNIYYLETDTENPAAVSASINRYSTPSCNLLLGNYISQIKHFPYQNQH